jgi:hypothetical protein
MANYDLKQLLSSDSEKGSVPEDVIKDLKRWYPESNAYQNYGVYMPRDTKVERDYDSKSILFPNVFETNPSGYVRPNWGKNTAHINRDQGSINSLNTIMHEATHTAQGTKDLKDMEGIKYPYYSPKFERPPADEILADLRAEEAMSKTGTTWDKTEPGQKVMQEMLAKHSDWSKADVKRYIDSRMFQEHSIMQSTPDKTSNKTPNKTEYFFEMLGKILKLLNLPTK